MKTFELNKTEDVWEEIVSFHYPRFDAITDYCISKMDKIIRDETDGKAYLKCNKDTYEVCSENNDYRAKWGDNCLVVKHLTQRGDTDWVETSMDIPF